MRPGFMPKVLFTPFCILCIILLTSFESKDLLNKPMPSLSAKTLDGIVINRDYFKGHCTLVSFMYIGCMPCMNEIGLLNRLKNEYANYPHFQILCIARQMKTQMIDFNTDNKSVFSNIRRALNVPPIQYAIQPACGSDSSKIQKQGEHVTLVSECNTISDVYGIDAFPTIFLVDSDCVIRVINKGGPSQPNDTLFYNRLKKEISSFLQ